MNDNRSTKDLLIGFGLVVLGAVITIGTLIAAEPGGSYWIMWGFMLIGVYYLLKGFFNKVLASKEAVRKLVWILVALTSFGIMIFGGLAVMAFMSTPDLVPPEDYEVVWEDNSHWDSMLICM